MKLLQIALSIVLFASLNTSAVQSNNPSSPDSSGTHQTSKNASTSSKKAPVVQLSRKDVEFIQKAFNATLMSIQQIDEIIGDLAILIGKHQINNLKSPDHVLRILIQDRQLLGSLLKVAASAKDAGSQFQYSIALLRLCEVFLPHLEKGLQKGLDNLEPFDDSAMMTKQIDIDSLTPNDVEAMIKKIYTRVFNLKTLGSRAGLTRLNLFARSVDKYIVSPWGRYHMTTVTKSALGGAVLGGYIIMRYGTSINNPVIQTIHTSLTNKLGILLDRNSQGHLVKSGQLSSGDKIEIPVLPHQATTVSFLDLAWNDIHSGHSPFALLLGGAMWGFYTEMWKNSISPWLGQKVTTAWNNARGGSHLNSSEGPSLMSIDPKVNFDHMVGLEEVRKSFEEILKYLDNPEKYLRSGSAPEMGWILTGPPRTGKSFSFECLCGEITRMQQQKGVTSDFKFLKLGIEEISKYGVSELLYYAKQNGPMILFIDEIDLLGLQRVGDNKLLYDFLTALQNTRTEDPSKIVIVMAATNSPETLDKALLHKGRFGKEIRFELPSFKHRKKYLIKELTSMALNPANFDIDSIVAKTTGKSYEDLKGIIRAAMTQAWGLKQPLNQKIIEDCIDTEISKIIMLDRKDLPESETRILASHFAGQALAMHHLGTVVKLDRVTTKAVMSELQETTAWHTIATDKKNTQQKIVHGAIFTKCLHDTIDLKTEADIINDAKVLLAGFIAEEIIMGSCGMQCHPEDNNKAYNIIDQLVFKGIDPTQLSKKVREQLRDKAYLLLNEYRKDVRQLLEDHKEELVALTQALIKEGVLSEQQVKSIIADTKK